MSTQGAPIVMGAVLSGRNNGWFANRGVVMLNINLCISLISSYATSYDGFMMNDLQSLDTWKAYFHDLDASSLALLNAIQNVGQLVALPFCAIACDKFEYMFVAARGILGIGLAFNITATPLLILELAFPTQRAPLLLSCYFIEESPRWLIDNGRGEKAKQIIIKYHTSGDAEDYMVLLELGEIGEALRIEKEALVNTSYLSFCKTKGNRLRFFIILAVGFLSQWSGNGLISYYLTLILNSVGSTSQDTQTLINGLLTIWGLVTTFFSSLVNKFGRGRFWTALKSTYEQSTDLAGEGSKGVAKGVLAMIFLYNLSYAIGWGPLGLVLYNLFVALALIFNQYVNPIGVVLPLEETAAIIDGTEVQEQLAEGVARATEGEKKIMNEETREVKTEIQTDI
ncbi:hypothetical protein BDZ45DRAFT_702752 [Acephala macrosclerotiorum]|nr:hypothetical protein BDZ45DRAFT_702752 [Acephala macrosclerotiorum]